MLLEEAAHAVGIAADAQALQTDEAGGVLVIVGGALLEGGEVLAVEAVGENNDPRARRCPCRA